MNRIVLPIYFAPLQGYTEDVYRRLHHELFGGVEEYCTPFVRLEKGEVRSKDVRDVRMENNVGGPLAVQVIASGGDEMRRVVEYVEEMGHRRIDINMGCPFPLQTKHGRGAGVLPHVEAVREICDVVREKGVVRFSVKMRLGLEEANEWERVLPILNDTPLDHVTLHPRVAAQGYKGTVDMAAFERFVEASKHPVVYNGDVRTVGEIQELEERYGIKGVMIGRGLLGRPTLGMEYQRGEEMEREEVVARIKELHGRMMREYERIIPSEAQRLMKVRTMWEYMEETLGRKTWKKIMKAGNMRNYANIIDNI